MAIDTSHLEDYVNRRLAVFLTVLSLVFLVSPRLSAQDDVVKNYDNSAWVVYDSAVRHINEGNLSLAEVELKRILNGFDDGSFLECFEEHTVRLLQYKANVVLCNIAFAEKRKNELYKQMAFFETADTSKAEWQRARCAAVHYKHKYYQLDNGNYGKVTGDWVSFLQSANGTPMVWIRVFVRNDTMCAELKDCGVRGTLNSKYPAVTNKIALDNTNNTLQINFGDDKLMPGLQILPQVLTETVYEMSDILTESIARQSITKYGNVYNSSTLWSQIGVNIGVTLLVGLISQLAVTKQVVSAESFVMEEIAPEVYMAKIKLRVVTADSNGGLKDEFYWAELPVLHLYSQEEMDFSKEHNVESMGKALMILAQELTWENSEESDKISKNLWEELAYSCYGIMNVDDTRTTKPFYFLGRNINFRLRDSSPTCFTGLASSNNVWGFKGTPINPKDYRSEVNTYITPLRGEFTTVVSPVERITFTGDWNQDGKSGSGLLEYTNINTPESNFTYEGTIWKGYPHGMGIWYGNGYKYVGWFFKGKKIGYGTTIYDDGREEQGFVTNMGDIVPEYLVTQEMKDAFNNKVKRILKRKYIILEDNEE